MLKQKCISQQAYFVVCRPSYIAASTEQLSSAGLSGFARYLSAKPVTGKVRLEVRSVPRCLPDPGREIVLAGQAVKIPRARGSSPSKLEVYGQ